VSLLLHVFVEEGRSGLSTIVSVLMLGHEATDPSHGTVFPKTSHLSITLDTVVFECLKGNGLVGALGLFGFGVDLLLTLFSAASQTKHKMQGGFLLDIVVTQSTTILQLLSGKNQTLLIGWDALLVLNLGLDIVNGVGRLHIQRNGLAYRLRDASLQSNHHHNEIQNTQTRPYTP